MKLKDITDVFFDLDHTLWDFDKNSALTFKKIFDIHNIEIALDDFLKVYEPINLDYWKMYREERIDKESLRYGRLKNSFDAVNYLVKDDVINYLADDYLKYLPSYNYLFNGTIETLEYLDKNYRLHIITNGFQEAQKGKLRNSKIDNYFKTVTDSEMVGVKKPNPLIFEHALHLANTTANSSVMIGDNWEADVQGALNAGIDAICFNVHGTNLDKNIKQVTTLLELKAFL